MTTFQSLIVQGLISILHRCFGHRFGHCFDHCFGHSCFDHCFGHLLLWSSALVIALSLLWSLLWSSALLWSLLWSSALLWSLLWSSLCHRFGRALVINYACLCICVLIFRVFSVTVPLLPGTSLSCNHSLLSSLLFDYLQDNYFARRRQTDKSGNFHSFGARVADLIFFFTNSLCKGIFCHRS